ncbi:MAG: MauE/DoxX family redox-associated membrane protein [Dehalococcoidia bacterium]
MANRSFTWMENGWLHLGLRLFVGGTFLFSAVSKLPHHTEFEGIVKDYELLPDALATAYANALPWVELFVGVYLVLGILVRPAAVVTLLMGVSFMIANISAMLRGDEHCGNCFGDVWTLAPWQSLTFDIFLLAAAVALLLPALSRQREIGLDRWFSRNVDSCTEGQ